MNTSEDQSIFAQYYGDEPFVDRYAIDPADAVDVIIPVIHTNELWRKNLISIYREIPVNRLILGDGGCIDESIDIAKQFPRVEVLDHHSFTSLGYSLRHLIEAVETDWFVYLHSDVYLPPDWFAAMAAHRRDYDWFECDQRITVMADYRLQVTDDARAFSGSQMGRKAAFSDVVSQIDDDFLYRNEDIILASLITRAGHRYGRVRSAFHFHQVMYKPGRWRRAIKNVDIHLDLGNDEALRASDTYLRGIVKYLDPDNTPADVIESLRYPISRLIEIKAFDAGEFRAWVARTNPKWLVHFKDAGSSARRDWIADRLIVAARLYRNQGARWLLWFVAKQAMKKLKRPAKSVSTDKPKQGD